MPKIFKFVSLFLLAVWAAVAIFTKTDGIIHLLFVIGIYGIAAAHILEHTRKKKTQFSQPILALPTAKLVLTESLHAITRLYSEKNTDHAIPPQPTRLNLFLQSLLQATRRDWKGLTFSERNLMAIFLQSETNMTSGLRLNGNMTTTNPDETAAALHPLVKRFVKVVRLKYRLALKMKSVGPKIVHINLVDSDAGKPGYHAFKQQDSPNRQYQALFSVVPNDGHKSMLRVVKSLELASIT